MDLSSRLLVEGVLCIGCLSLAVRSLERIITVIPKQKLNTAYFQMCNPWVVCHKKSVVQQYWELCLFWQLCWQPSLMGIAHRLPLCAAPPPSSTPHFSACCQGLHFNTSIFLKGMGYLRCRLYMWWSDSCSPGDGPSRAGCERAPLMAGLMVFSPVHQRCSVMGDSKRDWVIAGYFTWGNFCKGQTRGSPVEGPPGHTSEQILEKCKVPMPCSIFPCFTSIDLIIDFSILS